MPKHFVATAMRELGGDQFLDREVEVYIGDFWPATFHIQPAWNGTHLVFPDDASTDPALRGTILNPPEPSLYLYQKP